MTDRYIKVQGDEVNLIDDGEPVTLDGKAVRFDGDAQCGGCGEMLSKTAHYRTLWNGGDVVYCGDGTVFGEAGCGCPYRLRIRGTRRS